MSDRGGLRLIIVRSCFGMKCVLLTKPVIYEHIKLTVGASKTELGIKGYKITEYRSLERPNELPQFMLSSCF